MLSDSSVLGLQTAAPFCMCFFEYVSVYHSEAAGTEASPVRCVTPPWPQQHSPGLTALPSAASAPLRCSSDTTRAFPKSNSWSHPIGGPLVQLASAICAGLVAVGIVRFYSLLDFLVDFSSDLSSSAALLRTEAADMKLPAALLLVLTSTAVTVHATVYFQEQFMDGGTVQLILSSRALFERLSLTCIMR